MRRIVKILAVLAVALFILLLAGDTLLFYARVAKLYTQEPDSRIAMPLEDVSKKAITNTWHAPRGTGRDPRGARSAR